MLVNVVPSICNWSASNTPVTFVWSPAPSPKLMLPFAKIFPVAVKFPVTLVFAFNSIVPVPFGSISIFLLETETMSNVLTSKSPPNWGDVSSSISFASAVSPYNSEKFAFILLNAVLNGSPVPSFADEPTPIVCCAIF